VGQDGRVGTDVVHAGKLRVEVAECQLVAVRRLRREPAFVRVVDVDVVEEQ
jgi:hypothetical protein